MKLNPTQQWVKAAALKVGKQSELARLVSKRMRRDIDRSIINKMILGKRAVSADEMLAIEQESGLPAPSVNAVMQLPLIDWVAAGSLTEPQSQLPEWEDQIGFATLPRGDYIALKVKGNSMDRLCPEGAAIAVNRADRTLVSGKPYIFSVRGETTFKLWHANPEYLEPSSWDGSHKPTFVRRKRDLEVVGRVVQALVSF